MGIKITGTKNLNNLFRNLSKMQTDGLADRVSNKLANAGYSKAILNYSTSSVTGINVIAIPSQDGVSYIKASGDGLAYIEFGTGYVGKNSGYPSEKLPKETITFESPKGSPQSTQGWEYYYNNPILKQQGIKVNGGWYFGKTFTKGQPAGMQLYDTYRFLEENLKDIVINELRGGKK